MQQEQELALAPLYQDNGLPLKRLNWPQSRTEADYRRLLQLSASDTQLAKVLLDASMGDGNAAAQLKTSENTLIGITMHEAIEENVCQLDSVAYTSIPQGGSARVIHQQLRKKVNLALDVYGSTTYADNPIHALIYLGSLLSEDHGKAFCILSSIKGEHIDMSPIGFATTRRLLQRFFRESLNLKLSIRRTFIQSAMNPEDHCYDFLVNLTAQGPRQDIALNDLFQKADQWFGKPTPIKQQQNNWGNFTSDFSIIGKHYQKNQSPRDATWHSCKEEVKYKHPENEVIGISFLLSFMNPDFRNNFHTQFLEFYSSMIPTTWQVESSDNECKLSLFFHTPNSDINQPRKQLNDVLHGTVEPNNMALSS